MLGDPLVFSFQVETSSASVGLPWCAQGRQPQFVKPQFESEQVKPFLSVADIEDILNRLNKIFHETGCPPFPLFMIPILVMLLVSLPVMILAWKGAVGSLGFIALILNIPSFFICIGIYLWLISARKNKIMLAINSWNSTVGGPRGLYFNLGDSDGDSESMFWTAIYPRRIRVNRNRSLMVYTKGFLHLYTNPTARKHWCDKNGEPFVLPLPTQQPPPAYAAPQQYLPGYAVHQVPEYAVHQVPGYGMQQLPGHSLQPHQDPVYAVPQHPASGDSYGYNQQDHLHDYQHQVDGGDFHHHHHQQGHMNHGFD